MDVFYNPGGVGDVLIIPMGQGNRHDITHQTIGDITRILNNDDQVIGYNIFNARTHFNLEQTGRIQLTESLLSEIKQLFSTNGLQDDPDFDLSPSFVVGYVKEKRPHDNADKLSVCQVDTGDQQLQIVCGADNVAPGQKVVVAKAGATMPNGMKIESSELRGVPSSGMICSKKELDLPNASQEKGIYILDDSYQTGDPFTL